MEEARIHEKLSAVHQRINDVGTLQTKTSTILEDVLVTVRRIEKAIYEGNGKESILTRLTLLEDGKQSKTEDRKQRFQVWAAMIASGGAVLGTVINALANYMKN